MQLKSTVRVATPTVMIALGLAAVFGAGVATATAKSHAIKACVQPKSGALSLAKHGKCPHGDKSVSWNSRGPRGAAGAPAASLWAKVGYDGTMTASSKGITASHFTTGYYILTFPRDVTNCAYVASVTDTSGLLATPFGPGHLPSSSTEVYVTIRASDNSYNDGDFSIAVFC